MTALLSDGELVEKFNVLPQKAKTRVSGSQGLVSNEWYFDLRYIPIEQIVGHVLVLTPPQSQFMYIQRLPIGLSAGETGIAFFPESEKEAAPTIARGILYAFLQSLGHTDANSAFAPFKLMTAQMGLAEAVGEELKGLGVHANLHKISVSPENLFLKVHLKFVTQFTAMKQTYGFPDGESSLIPAPFNITFGSSTPQITDYTMARDLVTEKEPGGGPSVIEQCMNYVAERQRVEMCPPYDRAAAMMEQMQQAHIMILRMPESVIKPRADGGDDLAALDYGLRLRAGFGCMRSRPLAYKYLIQTALSPVLADTYKAMAHTALLQWHSNAHDGISTSRYILSACYHANAAAKICRRLAAHVPTAVLSYSMYNLQPLMPRNPELALFTKDVAWAVEQSDRKHRTGREKLARKTLKLPLRYCCAAPGCKVGADTGKMLSKCAGKCDSDKKPSYCSKECQKADWKNHKPFCRSGAECSVIDDDAEDSVASLLKTGPSRIAAPASGSFHIPVKHEGGSTTYLSSSTIDPEVLKEVVAGGDLNHETLRTEFHPVSFEF